MCYSFSFIKLINNNQYFEIKKTKSNSIEKIELNEIKMECSQQKIIDHFKLKKESSSSCSITTKTSLFKNRIKKGNDEECEKELNRLIKREDFKEMKVIGQYNQAFIISRLKNDLFILDQHACDEKYNYETLFETTIMNTQPLIM